VEKIYCFFWSPEGRCLERIKAGSYKQARAEFKKRRPQHAKHMGEVYHEVHLPAQQERDYPNRKGIES
jgi:hypothetical protein